MNDEILQTEELALELIRFLRAAYGGVLSGRFGVEENGDDFSVLKEISIKRGCLLKGNEPDIRKASSILLEEFRSGKLGRITLERPEQGAKG
jgi:ribosome biogenesis GTPase A